VRTARNWPQTAWENVGRDVAKVGPTSARCDESEEGVATTKSKQPRGKATKPQTVVVTAAGRVITVTMRPTWRESETATKRAFEPRMAEQTSFHRGQEVASGTKGSVRPDLHGGARSVEIKNYLIDSKARRDRLVRVVVQQAKRRASELPPGTRQTVRLDLSGQTGIVNYIPELASAIEERSGGIIRRADVHWTLSLFPEE
jgi:hypothetical protein